jgi:hypothetical protein
VIRSGVLRETHDFADVQIAVGPSVQATADSRRERVIDRGVTDRALDTDGSRTAVGIQKCRHAHDCVGLQKRDGRGWIVHIHLASLDRRDDIRRRQGFCVHLQPEAQGRLRAEGTNSGYI